jgi:AraC family transcriptional activator of pyochelin receptor
MKAKLRLSKDDLEALRIVKETILRDLSVHHSITELSALTGINRYKMTYGFRQLFDSGIYQFLREQRMLLASGLLQENELPIKEIAARCGFSDVHNFSTAFRKHFHQAPAKYRLQAAS